eukprot:CAMPEP_0117562172 /NCGR_PEP_ID=MMETSP0784-20121206/54814_1 /TAXON_ID=39447 /ORGANISM="" /LENGTH=50 /DNA_ID=CAMNT_0005359723 /DNA_START=126 /DNA_END=275 /DNA_ORIENTATION=+
MATRDFNRIVERNDADAHRFLSMRIATLLTKMAAEQTAIHGALAPMAFAD